MKLRKLFGIKTTKHSKYYRCYFLWLPYMKIRYKNDTTKIYLFGIQIAHVKTICEAKQPCIVHNIVAPQEEVVLNQRALEIITKHQDSDYTKVAK